MADRMTVVEFATMHADQCHCGVERVKHITDHVNLLVEAAVAHGRTLWTVGQDSDGRVSLIWASHDVEYWTALLAEAAQLSMLKTIFGIQ